MTKMKLTMVFMEDDGTPTNSYGMVYDSVALITPGYIGDMTEFTINQYLGRNEPAMIPTLEESDLRIVN